MVGCGINGQITNAESDTGRKLCKSGYRMWKNTQCTKDTFSVTNPGGISPPTLCGNNDGKHSESKKFEMIQPISFKKFF